MYASDPKERWNESASSARLVRDNGYKAQGSASRIRGDCGDSSNTKRLRLRFTLLRTRLFSATISSHLQNRSYHYL
jgi:hypothetical protein